MLIEFILIKQAATATFFLLLVISFFDVLGGFVVTLRSAQRDVTVEGRFILTPERDALAGPAKTLLTAAILISFAAPGLADQYYIVRGPDRHCTVTTTKPTEQTTITQIGPLAFESREKAEDRIKTTKVCTDDATTGSSVTIEKK